MQTNKMFIYTLTLENGQAFNYTFEGGITFNHKDEHGNDKVSIITSAVLLKSFEEDAPIIVETTTSDIV